MENAIYSVTKDFTVEFYDVDSMDVVWHGNYVKFMEVGRCALLDDIGYGYKEMVADGYVFPVTDIKLKYKISLKFGEKCSIRSTLTEYENCMKISYEIFNSKGELAAKGSTTQMAVKISTGESKFTCPELFVERVEKKIGKRQ